MKMVLSTMASTMPILGEHKKPAVYLAFVTFDGSLDRANQTV